MVMLDEMKRELSFYPDITLLYKEADGNTQLQIRQVKELLGQKVDLLIISPNEAEPLTPIVNEAYRKGIPVIIVDRKIASSDYTAYVGADNEQVGKLAGEYGVHLLRGKGRLVEVMLPPGSSPAAERDKGFMDAIHLYPALSLRTKINGELLKQHQSDQVAPILVADPGINLVFAQNDFLALKIADLYKSKGLNKPNIIGVDGLLGKDEGMQLVADKTITATLLYPTGGQEAIQIALNILNKQPFSKDNILQTTIIDSTNERIMQLQAEKAASQQKQNERQQELLTEQKKIYNNQQTFVYILISSLVLALVFGGIAVYSLRENRKINKKLSAHNDEILKQKEQLEILSARAREANEAKVNFFTNITHEFRTPLTLILGPLEELMTNSKTGYYNAHNISLIHKNAQRLLRLVNQLMDFRKIEVDKMKLHAAEQDLVGFVAQIVQSYKKMAQKRGIDLQLIIQENQLRVWMDEAILDKVLFNLLSNAFKFTADGGFIYVYVKKSNSGKEAVIKVEDNGIGMNSITQEHAFDLFYQGEHEHYDGAGIGLALSRELIHLHKGSIQVESEKEKGTVFTVTLPLGREHLREDELLHEAGSHVMAKELDAIYMPEPNVNHYESDGNTIQTREYSLLIIEDNKDLRDFLSQKLGNEFEIHEADNGQTALQQAFDLIPDLIICDLVIPGKNGLDLIRILKNDIRTSHVPVVLLTAKTRIEQQIEGMTTNADVYITKPFNVRLLEETIHSLLANRKLLRDHMQGTLSVELKTQTISKLDRKFMLNFKALIESNIANIDFSVEDICKNMGVSKGLLYKKIKRLLHTSVNEYILDLRIQKAKYLLQHECLSVGEVAYKVGFSSPAYFATVFKNKIGITPTSFKGG
jgi:signal transduction histidine kinase/DNA-binding response OmpR family regulator